METTDLYICGCCAAKHEPVDIFCNTCGYPLQGTQQQQDDYIANRAIKEIDLEDLNKKVKTATASLYWIGGFLAFWTVVNFFMMQEDPDLFAILITNVILVAAFLIFAVWSKTKPTAALISGLSLYAILIILNAIADPKSLISGIIFKFLIIAYLIKGIIAVLEVDKIKKELNIK